MNKEIGCSREKYWSELSDGKKIERMREQVKSLQGEIKQLRKSVFRLLIHKHLDGEIVTPVDNREVGFEDVRRLPNPNEVYF